MTESAYRLSQWEEPPAPAPLSRETGSFSRLWHAFMSARITVAAVLLTLQASLLVLNHGRYTASLLLCVFYLAATISVRILARPQPPGSSFDAQWLSTVGVDVLTFSALNYLQAGSFYFTPLFALPVLLASVLGPMMLALGTAASVALFLLADAWHGSLQAGADPSSRFLQAGLSGFGFFVIALLANQLAQRLAREERRARLGGSAARMQSKVNQLVMETLADGVLVIDAAGSVRSANPAARDLLECAALARSGSFTLDSTEAWAPLSKLAERTFVARAPQEANVSLAYSAADRRRVHVRTRLAQSGTDQHNDLCVMFLEDLREMEARIRTEKMAAMGRMSAAVAHEIRNPLSAISQANGLLEEDLTDPFHQQLTSLVRQNVQRLDRIVEEVLDVSRARNRRMEADLKLVGLDAKVARICADWAHQTAATRILQTDLTAGQPHIVFEEEHLRRVLVNLLDNALRYASARPGAIRVGTQLTPTAPRLCVWSDGEPLEKSVLSHLFEPFFSSESRSSGLGLYLCRELCERYGATLGYQRVTSEQREGNEFFVVFQTANDIAEPPVADFDKIAG
ncbi:MAG: ATP-binding protein [Pseudomonadota bacterium]